MDHPSLEGRKVLELNNLWWSFPVDPVGPVEPENPEEPVVKTDGEEPFLLSDWTDVLEDSGGKPGNASQASRPNPLQP